MNYPPSSNNNTWLAFADQSLTAAKEAPRGARRVQFFMIDPVTGNAVRVVGYFHNKTDLARFAGSKTFLVIKKSSYQKDGDLFTTSDYNTSMIAPAAIALRTYATPGVKAKAEAHAKLASKDVSNTNTSYSSLHTDIDHINKSSSKQSLSGADGDASGAVGSVTSIAKPYAWSPAPMPHWAMFIYDKPTETGTITAEILQPASYIRIGTVSVQHGVGPIDLQITQAVQTASLPTLRQGQSIKRISGNIRKTIEFTLQFPNSLSIVNELVPLLRQAKYAPFVPVIHRELYDAGIDALAIESITVSTSPGNPQMLQAQVRAYQFNWQRYMLDAEEFDLCFNYPLLDLWLNKVEVPKNSYDLTVADLSLPWDGSMKCYVPSRDWLALVNENSLGDVSVAETRAAFINPKDPRNNSLFDAVRSVYTGDTTALPKVTPTTKLTGPVVGELSTSHRDVVLIPLTSTAMLETALASVDEGGADAVMHDPYIKVMNLTRTPGIDSKNILADGAGVTPRSLLRTQITNTGAFQSGYWAAYNVGRRLPSTVHPGHPVDHMSTPLGIAAQESFLSPDNPVYLPVPDFDGLVIQGITAHMSNVLAEFSPEDEETPVLQHMGASDSTVVIEGLCPEHTARLIEDFIREVTKLAVDFRGQWNGTAFGGYCYLSNEVARVCGFTTAIPVALTVDTVPNFPSERRISISFVSFDPGQRRQNIPQDFHVVKGDGTNPPGTMDSTSAADFNDQAQHAPSQLDLERFVQAIEIMPDLRLPDWKELTRWVTALTAKKQQVWNYKTHKPMPGFEFVTRWSYPEDYWPTDKNIGYLSCLDIDTISGPHSHEDFKVPVMAVTDTGGGIIPGLERTGYADPDFYCSSRGDAKRKTNYDRFEAGLQSIMGSNGVSPSKSVYWGSEGIQATAKLGTKDVKIVKNASSVKALETHRQGVYTGGDIHTPCTVTSVPFSCKSVDPNAPQTTAPVPDGNGAAFVGGGGFSPMPEFGGKYLPEIRAASSTWHLPIAIIQAIIWSESSGNVAEHTKDSKGAAWGIMQKYFKNGVPVPANILTDVNVCLNAGCQEFQVDLNKNHGDYKKAILAYRGGQGAVYQSEGRPQTDPYSSEVLAGMEHYTDVVFAHYNQLLVRKNLNTIDDQAARAGSKAAPVHVASAHTTPVNKPAGTKPLGQEFHDLFYTKTAADDYIHGLLNTHTKYDDAVIDVESFDFKKLAKDGKKLLAEVDPAWIAGSYGSPGELVGKYFKQLIDPITDKLDENAKASADAEAGARVQDADTRAWDIDRASYDPLFGEDVFFASRRAESSGRLAQAFPSYLILLIDGGSVFRIWRLSDVFYGLHSAMSITTFSSRKVAADSAVVTFADPYNNLSAIAADIALQTASDTRMSFTTANGFLTLDGTLGAGVRGIKSYFMVTEEEAERRQQDLKSLLVKSGSRMHVRLGFGSDASALPVVFNGTISGVRRQNDVIEVTALGDGQELTNQLSPNSTDQGMYVRNGNASSGENIRNIIASFFTDTEADMIAQQGGLIASATTAIANLTNGYFLGGNPYGIAHFGSPNRHFTVTDIGECGVNIYSGFNGAPVNVTYAIEDVPIVSGIVGIYKGLTEDIPQAIAHETDLMLGMYSGDGYAKSMDECGLFRKFNGEPIVGLNMENATPWDIISTLRYVASDYIRQVEPFGLRSTLFFGKSYWPLHYKYDVTEIQKAKQAKKDDVGSDAWDTTYLGGSGQKNAGELGNIEAIYRRRPYLQVHVAHSGSNLLGCIVEAQDETWCSIVQSMGSTVGLGKDAVESSYAQFLDVNIFPEFQRQKVVKSGLYSSIGERLEDTLYTVGTSSPFISTNVLNNHAVGVLHDEVKEMYQGNIVTTGNGWVRPFHLMHLNDEMKKLTGLVEVREVLHSLTPDGGFTTTVTPDCLANATDPSLPFLWGHCITTATRIFAGNSILKIATSKAGRFLLRRAVAQSMYNTAHMDEAFGSKIGSGLAVAEQYVTSKLRTRLDPLLGKYVSQARDRIYNMSGKVGFADFSSAKDGVTEHAHIRDMFKKAIIEKEKSGRERRVPEGARSNLGEFKRKKFIDEDIYKEIHSDIANRYYISSVERYKRLNPALEDGTPEEIEQQIANEEEALANMRKRTLETVDRVIGRYNPLDKEGNVIEDDRLLLRAAKFVDPYGGYGSIFEDITKRKLGQGIRWAGNTPAGLAKIDPVVLDQLKRLKLGADVEEEIKALFKGKEGDADAIEKSLLKYSELYKKFGKIDEGFDKDLKDNEDALAKLKEDGKKLRGEDKKINTKAILKNKATRKLLLNHSAQAKGLVSGPEAAAKARALANFAAHEERLGKLVRGAFDAYGNYIPTDEKVLKKGADKVIGSIADSTHAVKEMARAVEAARKGEKATKAAATVASLSNPVFFMIKTGLSLVAGSFLTVAERSLQSRHALVVTPLLSNGREFSAGINGHRGLCVGDHLGPVDSCLSFLFDDVANPGLLTTATGMLGLSVHYGADPDAYKELMSGAGFKIGEDIEDVHKRHAEELAHLNNLNALGFNLTTAAAQGPQAPGGGQLVQGPLLTDRTGPIAEHYKSAVQQLMASPNIHSTGGLIQPSGEAAKRCAKAIKQALVKTGVFSSYPGSADAIELNKFCKIHSFPPNKIFDRVGATPFSKVPNGALCFWDDIGEGHGHVAFAAEDSVGRYILGNTDGELKYRALIGRFQFVTSYYLPVSTAPVSSKVSVVPLPKPKVSAVPLPKPKNPG